MSVVLPMDGWREEEKKVVVIVKGVPLKTDRLGLISPRTLQCAVGLLKRRDSCLDIALPVNITADTYIHPGHKFSSFRRAR